MTNPVLAINNLTVDAISSDGTRSLVRNISFNVHAGETLCVVGESGSGKSVTSLAVMGLLPSKVMRISQGGISLAGEPIQHASDQRLRALRASSMAMVFQEPMTALNPVQTVGQQVEEVLRLHSNMPKTQRKMEVLQMLESVHLPDPSRIYSAYPHQLSGGQRQRIVIAMALILKPALLIADEPTTALDVTTQKQILLLIKELQQRQGTAVMFITHDFGVVADIADRIVVMNQGRIVESGTRDDILRRPKEKYTRTLISSVPSLAPRASRVIDGKAVLSVEGLQKIYSEKSFFKRKVREVVAANDISLTVRQGEITGIVGESGSGKSTVARCMVRLVQASGGQVKVNATDIMALPAKQMQQFRQKVQIVFQDPYRSLNPRRNIGDSMVEGLLNFGVEKNEALKKVAQALQIVGLPASVMERYPHQFSGGQRQRLCIARAVVMEPDLLIADEAVSALDVSVQAQVLQLFEDIRDRTGVAILFITHDLRVAARICDTIVVMQHGRIVEAGASVDVLSAPREAYTQSLIGAAPGRDWDFQNFRPMAHAG